MEDKEKLPPLPDSAFDGYKESTEIKPNLCAHKETEIISGNELRCKLCPASWNGSKIIDLQNLLTNRAS